MTRSIFDDLDTVFGAFTGALSQGASEQTTGTPKTDPTTWARATRSLLDKDKIQWRRDSGADQYVTEVDVPGYRAEDITVRVASGVISITTKERHEPTRTVRPAASTRLKLPPHSDPERVSTLLRDGVLLISAPISLANAERTVEIHVG